MERRKVVKCPHCGGEIDPFTDDYRIQAREKRLAIRELWNELAAAENLPVIQQMTRHRQRAWDRRIVEDPYFFSKVQEAVKRRGEWAREKRFPTFDQAVRPSFLAKLLEGNYDGDPAEERDELIQKIQGKKFGKVMATAEGLEGGVGVEKWVEISTERLRSMAAVQIADESF